MFTPLAGNCPKAITYGILTRSTCVECELWLTLTFRKSVGVVMLIHSYSPTTLPVDEALTTCKANSDTDQRPFGHALIHRPMRKTGRTLPVLSDKIRPGFIEL